MQFNPNNHVIQLCIQGITHKEKNQQDEAGRLFSQAWDEATNDFEKFLAAYFVARQQKEESHQLQWLEKSLHFAREINNENVRSALPTLYSNISKCYEKLGDINNAKQYKELASSLIGDPSDPGPFYHGTRASLQVGDFLTAGSTSNYDPNLTMNHIYFTALVHGAGLAAALAKGEGEERVYLVEPTGSFEDDPNVTDKKFPGNLTRSYRSREPLKIIGELKDWRKQTPEEIQKWREKLANNNGTIIN